VYFQNRGDLTNPHEKYLPKKISINTLVQESGNIQTTQPTAKAAKQPSSQAVV